jgi:hypothetical protein
VSLVGIDLITVEARVVVASIDTHLGYAEVMGITAPVAKPPSLGFRPRPDKPDEPRAAAGVRSPLKPTYAGLRQERPHSESHGLRLGNAKAHSGMSSAEHFPDWPEVSGLLNASRS